MEEVQASSDELFPKTFTWGAVCLSCKAMFPPLRDTAVFFFENGAVPCPKCGVQVDVWELTKNDLRSYIGTFIGLGQLGANQTIFLFELTAGQTKNLNFTEHGVPPSAVVLSVIYTPQGNGCFPVEFHTNEARQRSHKPTASVYGVAFGNNAGPIKIATLVTWVDEPEEPEAWTMLADAFQAAVDQWFSRVVVPAY